MIQFPYDVFSPPLNIKLYGSLEFKDIPQLLNKPLKTFALNNKILNFS